MQDVPRYRTRKIKKGLKMSNHYKRCNYCRQVKPAEEFKGFKCKSCMDKDAKKANKDKANG